MLDAICDALNSGLLKSVLTLLRVFFYVLCIGTIYALCVYLKPHNHVPSKNSKKKPFVRVILIPFLLLIIIGFVSILIYQSTWQLSGFTSPEFVRFMERYNPRADNAAHKLIRGEILDCKGRVLAKSEPNSYITRSYPYGAATAHIVGYRHPTEGLTGMENAADYLLSGYSLDKETQFKLGSENALKEMRNVGTNVVLTIDAKLQQRAHELMNGRKGAVVAIDPDTGAIRVLLSSPSYDPNNFTRMLLVDKASPLLNRALHGHYPAGSTFKTLIAAMMVECGVPQTLPCPAEGYYAPGARRPIRDHEYYTYEKRGLKWHGFGSLDLNTALSKSSNTYFARAGVESGVDPFNDLIERLGFKKRYVLFEGASGVVSSRESKIPFLKKGMRRELSQLSIGQGQLAMTPFHMAMLASAFANKNGDIMAPHLLEKETPRVYSEGFSQSVAARVRTAMRYVVTHGTGRGANVTGLEVCGKTGTAQNPGGDDHSWFICFNNTGSQRLAIAVIVENAGFGSSAALPVAVGVLQAANPISAPAMKNTSGDGR